jgi:tetratricopeptide (TPR) repeat protein
MVIMMNYCLLAIVWLSFCLISSRTFDANAHAPEEEPLLFSYRVLEGVTEPFASPAQGMPLWKQMKATADGRAAKKQIQQALVEYGQLLKHPLVFGEMPLQERYEVFLSMSSLLRLMGFHQKAELVLYEALGYSTSPFEAHFNLASLFLEKEKLDKAKMHLKQCLYFKETDLQSLIHLAVILIAEGKIHEAKFYITRIQAALMSRLRRLSEQGRLDADLGALEPSGTGSGSVSVGDTKQQSLLMDINYQALTMWLEALLSKVCQLYQCLLNDACHVCCLLE